MESLKNVICVLSALLTNLIYAQVHKMEFVTIPAGKFTMGSPSSEKDRNDDEKQVEVVISKAFEMMTTEVTQHMWFDVMKENPSHFKTPEYCNNHLQINGKDLCPNHPVEQVLWSDVQAYIKRLNEAKGLNGCRGTPRDPRGCYRLPTEAEWEYAARGGTRTAYSFGSADIKDYAWNLKNSNSRTHPVKIKMANPYGLFDMHGNVWEWVQDFYTVNLPGKRDPLVFSGPFRVSRGGGWPNGEWNLRSAVRLRDPLDYKGYDVGFRLVRNL